MTVEFDPRCATSQDEDYFDVLLDNGSPLVLNQRKSPGKIIVVPGHSMTFTMNAASNYLPNVAR